MSSYQSTDSILLIESDETVRNLAKAYLNRHNFRVTAVSSGEEALNFFVHAAFDLILTELKLPGIDGFDLLRETRAKSNTPFMVASSSQDKTDRVRLLNAGADDFLAKPFYPEELVARVRALLRRSRLPSRQIETQALLQRPARKSISLYGKIVEFTQREFDVLSILCSEPTRIFSRDELFDSAWGSSEKKVLRRIDLYISRIRIKVLEQTGHELIQSIYGKGYRIQAEFAGPRAQDSVRHATR